MPPSFGSPASLRGREMDELRILVVQAESLGAIAVIRSLGRAGHLVHAAATNPNALGLRSKLASAAVVCPEYLDEGFVPWLRAYVRAHRIDAIIPSEGFLLGLGEARREFLGLCPFAREELILPSLSKYDLFERLIAQGAPHLPPTLLVPSLERLPSLAELDRLGTPLHVKVDGSHALDGSGGVTRRAGSAAEALELLAGFRASFSRALVQGDVPGQGVGAFFLHPGNGEITAEFMHRRLHEVPWTGGVSALRESWRHPAILADARAKLLASGWEGVAMMEYRWDPATNGFAFIEMNSRFWGSLHLALFAGVDFPRLLIDRWRGAAVHGPRAWPRVRSRQLVLEIRHVWSKLKSSEFSSREKGHALLELLQSTLDPRVRNDLLFPGDRALFWRSLRRFARTLRTALNGRRLAQLKQRLAA